MTYSIFLVGRQLRHVLAQLRDEEDWIITESIISTLRMPYPALANAAAFERLAVRSCNHYGTFEPACSFLVRDIVHQGEDPIHL